MSYYEQTFKPFKVCPTAWNDPLRFYDLAPTEPMWCADCDAPIGWETVPNGETDGAIWHDYYAMNEDLEIGLCPQCYPEGE